MQAGQKLTTSVPNTLCRTRDTRVFLGLVRFLSNLFSRVSEPQAPTRYAIVSPDQLQQALTHLLSYPGHVANPHHIASFQQSAAARRMDLTQMRIATRGPHVLYAICPVPLPGRTVMLLSGTPADPQQREAGDALLQQVVTDYQQTDNALLQVLVDPEDMAQIAMYRLAGFTQLAELVYLECPGRPMPHKLPGDGWQLLTYSAQRHQLFAQAILASYEQTLDCPALSGLRSIDDVILGHKAAGEFEPRNWLVLMQEQKPAGVLILSRVPASDALELTYVGLARFARGRGIASELVKLAINRTAELGCTRLTTAADSLNTPALTMYIRAGMHRVGARLALIRVIHRREASSSTIDPQDAK